MSQGGGLADAGLEEVHLQYVDYALWQHESLSPLLSPQREYWRSQLREGALPALDLPLDFARPAVQTFAGAAVAVALSEDVSLRLESIGRSHGCTLFQLVVAMWSLLLCRHAGQEEVVVGTPYHGRDAAGTEGMIWYFVNMLALRLEVARGESVSSLLRQARDVAAGAMRHAAVPWQVVVQELLPRRSHDASRNAVFQTMLSWEEGSIGDVQGVSTLLGASVEVTPLGRGSMPREAKC